MEDKIFKTICDNLNKRIAWCDSHIGILKKNGDIKNISVEDYMELLNQSKVYRSEMDKIYGEMNHLLYISGLLTVQQTSKLISLMKDFCIYRSDIKILSTHNSLLSLPDIPKNANYDFTTLFNGHITIPARCSGDSTILITENVTEIQFNNSSNNIENTSQNTPSGQASTFYRRGDNGNIIIEFPATDDNPQIKRFKKFMDEYLGIKHKKKKQVDLKALVGDVKASLAKTYYNMRLMYYPETDMISTVITSSGANKTVRDLYQYLDAKLLVNMS